MSLSLQTIEKLAPDQASLSAAKKLLSDNKWQNQGLNQDRLVAWGECLGSGSKPYYVVVDTEDQGYKCTCPSRKFPCKHALALMWRYVSSPKVFGESAIPNWVDDWLGRRRKTSNNNAAKESSANNSKSIAKTQLDDTQTEKPIDPKKALAIEKRAQKAKQTTDEHIQSGINELKQWLTDQLRLGVGAFMEDMYARCRQIAARLVDNKAGVLAARLDELPSLVLSYPKDMHAKVVIAEFSRLYLLCQAWQKNPDDVDVRQAITQAETKAKIINDNNALRHEGIWRVIGEFSENKKDGLTAQVSYLIRMDDKNQTHHDLLLPNFALILDYYHTSSGIKQPPSQLGDYLQAKLCFYPSQTPLRAFFEHYQTKKLDNQQILYYGQDLKSQTDDFDVLQFDYAKSNENLYLSYIQFLEKKPYDHQMPFMLKSGRIIQQNKSFWYQNQEVTLPLINTDIPLAALTEAVDFAFILWQGDKAKLISIINQTGGIFSCLD